MEVFGVVLILEYFHVSRRHLSFPITPFIRDRVLSTKENLTNFVLLGFDILVSTMNVCNKDLFEKVRLIVELWICSCIKCICYIVFDMRWTEIHVSETKIAIICHIRNKIGPKNCNSLFVQLKGETK